MKNEREFALRLCRHLDVAAADLAPATAHRLRIARQDALARSRVASIRTGLAGGGVASLDEILPALRPSIAVAAIALAAAGFSYWNSLDQASELAEVDTALLADELPINAYLDQGFPQWLKRSSPE
ncbi:MAG: hypothetical protein Fur0039_26230 [Rhodocyclaceae bacterium]